MTNYISVQFKAAPEKAAIIIAFFMDLGFEGAEEDADQTTISIEETNYDQQAVEEIMQQYGIDYSANIVAQQNWNAQWESSFEPVVVDDFVSVRASFHPQNGSAQHDIIITPKMSFGTGHHATTYLMIQLMQDIDFDQKVVIDFGTGTGVLAVLAEKLGASHVLGIDNDEWSINNSEENIAANHCKNIRLQLANEMLHHQQADIILANINLNVIVDNLPNIKEACKPGAYVLFSGLMTADEEIISKKLSMNNFHIEKIVHRNGWIALLTKPLVSPQH